MKNAVIESALLKLINLKYDCNRRSESFSSSFVYLIWFFYLISCVFTVNFGWVYIEFWLRVGSKCESMHWMTRMCSMHIISRFAMWMTALWAVFFFYTFSLFLFICLYLAVVLRPIIPYWTFYSLLRAHIYISSVNVRLHTYLTETTTFEWVFCLSFRLLSSRIFLYFFAFCCVCVFFIILIVCWLW